MHSPDPKLKHFLLLLAFLRLNTTRHKRNEDMKKTPKMVRHWLSLPGCTCKVAPGGCLVGQGLRHSLHASWSMSKHSRECVHSLSFQPWSSTASRAPTCCTWVPIQPHQQHAHGDTNQHFSHFQPLRIYAPARHTILCMLCAAFNCWRGRPGPASRRGPGACAGWGGCPPDLWEQASQTPPPSCHGTA